MIIYVYIYMYIYSYCMDYLSTTSKLTGALLFHCLEAARAAEVRSLAGDGPFIDDFPIETSIYFGDFPWLC